MTLAEAQLHGLMEALEGDAMSFALLDWYARQAAPPRIVRPDDVPPDLADLWRLAETVTGCPPAVFDITTDLGIPAFCAVPSRFSRLGALGAGASLNPGCAAERAVIELMEAHEHIADFNVEEVTYRMLANLRQLPGIRRCVTLDADDLAGRAVPIAPQPAAWWNAQAGDPADQVKVVLGRLDRAGLHAYQARWSGPESGICVLTVLVPGLETFFLSRMGVPVLPSGRGARTFGLR